MFQQNSSAFLPTNTMPVSNIMPTSYQAIGQQDERLGGFLGPFLLGGITGGLVAPFFYGGGGYGNNYNQPPYYTNNYYYPPFPGPYGPYYY